MPARAMGGDNVTAWQVITRDINDRRPFDVDRFIIDIFPGIAGDVVRAIEAAPAITAAKAAASVRPGVVSHAKGDGADDDECHRAGLE